MDLRSNYPYWLMKNGMISPYPSLRSNINVDIAIMGAGISGALAAHYLQDCGFSIAIADKRHAGMGSTAASTAFLQYEIDTPLTELCKYVGNENAIRSYSLCRKAIYDLQAICKKNDPALDFKIIPSLQYASFPAHIKDLYKEYELRLKNGFKVKWLDMKGLADKFCFDAPGAILSEDGGEVDAYILTHHLLSSFYEQGHQVYNNTEVSKISHNKKGIVLYTKEGYIIKAKKLIIACGYESLKYIPHKIAEVHSTYAIVSEPLQANKFWYKNSLVWETAEPYMYYRVVDNNRVLVGGKDDPYHHTHIDNARIKHKGELLKNAFEKKMKHIYINIDFSWAGAFGITKDGLPYIGCIPHMPHTYFTLGFGGNGITFSVIGAEIIRDMILNKKNENAGLFSFNR